MDKPGRSPYRGAGWREWILRIHPCGLSSLTRVDRQDGQIWKTLMRFLFNFSRKEGLRFAPALYGVRYAHTSLVSIKRVHSKTNRFLFPKIPPQGL